MTVSETEVDTEPEGDPAPRAEAERGGDWGRRVRRARAWLWAEGLLALEIAALTSFVVARPVFDSFGDSPETFIARGADAAHVVQFGLIVALGPPLVLAAVAVGGALVARAFGAPLRPLLQAVVVGGLGGVVVWQLLWPVVRWPTGLTLAACTVGAAALGMARWRWEASERFLRYAAVGTVVFLLQFLVASPTASIVGGGRSAGVDEEARAAVEAAVGDDGPPVFVIVLDGLPTATLLDGAGRIDADLYPNLAELASGATWYRNHTTVAQITLEAVPAILSGTMPGASEAPVVGDHPDNLFTLLGGVYDVHGGERITSLCPTELCPVPGGTPVNELLRDARQIWHQTMTDTRGDPELIPAAFADRTGYFERWLNELDFAPVEPGGRPGLYFHHLLVPHAAWEYLPDGTPYAATQPPSGLFAAEWGAWGNDVARQRHVLQTQTTDMLLGWLFDRLREAGTYDDALIVVTADHGYAFDEEAPWRGVSEETIDDILWTPLLVKSPGQTEAEVDDSNVNATDILPTIAAELGVELPYEIDGEPAGSAERDPGDKSVVDWEWGRLRAEDGDGNLVPVDGDEGFRRVLEADWVEGEGPLAVWQRTEHGGLVGQAVGDLDVGDPDPATLDVDALAQWDHVDTGRPPLELTATAMVEVDSRVAVAVNGVVAAVAPAEPTAYGVAIVHALLYPGPLRDGANEITAYVVEGDPGAEVLQPLDVRAKS